MSARHPKVRSGSVTVILCGAVALLANASTACDSGCTPAHDESYVADLGALGPESDAGITGLPWCSACVGTVVPGNLCEGMCAVSRPELGHPDESTCLIDSCITTVRDPASSCGALCGALLPDVNLTGCSLSAGRSNVTCTYHLEEACRCSIYDC